MANKRVMLAVAAAALAWAGAGARGQGVIELRPSARVEAGAIRLGDVALLEGKDAEALRNSEIVAAGDRAGSAAVTLEQVKAALERNGKPNWGRLLLRGGTCRVSASAAPVTAAPVASAQASARAADPTGGVRSAVARRIAQLAQADPGDLRLAFAPEDDGFLALPIAGRTVEIKPTASSERLPLAVTVYEGDRIVASRTIRVGVEVRRQVCTAAAAKRKGETLAREDLSSDTQWMPLSTTVATAEQLAGAVLRNRLNPGQAISAEDVAPPLVVSKGDQVTVHCISGSVVVTTRARAVTSGHDGEVIEFEALDSKRRFTARMNGKGQAVVASAQSAEGGR